MGVLIRRHALNMGVLIRRKLEAATMVAPLVLSVGINVGGTGALQPKLPHH